MFLYTQKSGDFGAISVTARICAAPISKVERHLLDKLCATLWCCVKRYSDIAEMIKYQRGLESTETEVNIQVEDLDLGHQILSANCSGLTLKTLKVISVKFLLVTSMLCKTEWSWKLRSWSHKMNFLDILSTSPHYFYGKWIGATNENLILILGFKGLNAICLNDLFQFRSFAVCCWGMVWT